MLDPRDIYDVDVDVAERVDAATRDGGAGPVLVHAVRGFVDAGHAGQVAVDHLVSGGPAQRLVTFDVDQLVDYRSRRPVMTFDEGWTGYDAPELVVDLLHDAQGTPFLLLHGLEPDVQWERWVAAVRQVVERFDVPLVVGLHGIPMGVPHTRPISVTAHATRADLVADHTSFFGTVQVPASASALLELRLGEAGHDAMGFAVHVPHYLAQSPYPAAGLAGLRHVQRAAGLDLRLADLEPAAAEATREVERQVEGSSEVAAVVQALEEQYDAFTRSVGRTSLLAQATDLPTAEEIGAELERFLATQVDEGGDEG
ncbi:MAG: PAC2 family protein [Cellulomonas iranensis]|jgi:predicted ATP-grasp superfamily ATP-dependent carboligase|uniref:ATP-grasp superfamily ATP-dependent carboligase n=1 Tax=Cellulomonas iranensis TaxID=76862 RepID=A0ABU0GEI3_9CELL|nr:MULTISPECIES: PAC2 family protein [Cellulomonas]MBO9568400.1 PAC2 family protein [Cellulomonas iranensis]MDQ0423767.1 putative ATP-grasp superfamily ATP-dependent carboligase [Cellulomonas iranensis]TFH72603.1 PAC2 family protein [Cellulomonas sp. HD19AZ1]